MRIVNIYGQPMEHMEAKITGNREGLTHLRDVIDSALATGRKQNTWGEPLFASDGEGYTIIIECHDNAWGISGDDSYWNREESYPFYTRIL